MNRRFSERVATKRAMADSMRNIVVLRKTRAIAETIQKAHSTVLEHKAKKAPLTPEQIKTQMAEIEVRLQPILTAPFIDRESYLRAQGMTAEDIERFFIDIEMEDHVPSIKGITGALLCESIGKDLIDIGFDIHQVFAIRIGLNGMCSDRFQ